ncbi:37361_t:CDS:2, partial [Gigaspora margarita]
KEKLPSTPQALNFAVKYLFSCDPKDVSELCTLVKIQLKYTFPITDNELAKEFIKEIKDKYKFRWPFPLHYMTANPTKLPLLPTDHTK